MLYPLHVDMALVAMNVSPAKFDDDFLPYSKQVCNSIGLTPQEAALVIVAKDGEANCSDDTELAIKAWQDQGSIDPSEPAVAGALTRLGLSLNPEHSL